MFSTPISNSTTTNRRTRPALALLAAVGLTALAGCGSNGGDPSTVTQPHGGHSATMPGHDMGHDMAGHMGDPGKGLLISENGYTLKPTLTTLKVGAQTVSFQILDAGGQPQTQYTLDQTKLLHFYLIRADLTGYQHLHPTLSNGTWSVAVAALTPGPYRMYTDFIAKDSGGADKAAVLSTTLTVPGSYTATPLPAASSSSTADGITATMTGTITAGTESKVDFQFTENGKPVTDLEPYLDSFAHMTALNASDLAYQHVHPEMSASTGQKGGPSLAFAVDLPEKGTWRLFLQVQRAGALHLLPLTVTVT
jgi:hypothetical protein